MKTPIYVRELTETERARLKTGLRSQNQFEIHRSQIVLASARKETARRIARTLGCDDQTVRNVIKKFNAIGLEALKSESRRPHTIATAIAPEKIEQLKDLLHQSPRKFGKETSLWTLGSTALKRGCTFLPRIYTNSQEKFEKFVQFVAEFPCGVGHHVLLWRYRSVFRVPF